MAKLDIIIPCYNARETIERTLSSINLQTIKNDIHVYIINDSDGLEYSDIITYWLQKLHIIYISKTENEGAGMARQFGLEISNSEFVMFIDADDCLASAFACELLWYEAKTNNRDMVCGAFDNDVRIGDKFYVGETIDSTTWLHGKLFKREYLEKNQICFNANLRTNEDVYFNQLVLAYQPNASSIKKICYSWIFNLGSLTRTGEPDGRYNILYDYINAAELFALEVIKRKLLDNKDVVQLVTDNLMVVYRYYNEILDTHDKEHSERFLKRCKEYYQNALAFIPEALDDDVLTFSNKKLLKNDEFSGRIPMVSIPEFAKSIMD